MQYIWQDDELLVLEELVCCISNNATLVTVTFCHSYTDCQSSMYFIILPKETISSKLLKNPQTSGLQSRVSYYRTYASVGVFPYRLGN